MAVHYKTKKTQRTDLTQMQLAKKEAAERRQKQENDARRVAYIEGLIKKADVMLVLNKPGSSQYDASTKGTAAYWAARKSWENLCNEIIQQATGRGYYWNAKWVQEGTLRMTARKNPTAAKAA
jgi:hypothetical protein